MRCESDGTPHTECRHDQGAHDDSLRDALALLVRLAGTL
jgi:hypothetical protein